MDWEERALHLGLWGRAVEVVTGWHHPEDSGTSLVSVVEYCGP